ncbi:VCBS repeat-containing protein [Streptomyces sp. I05A-00742]|uniref:FG-GAP repeat domain-containing protein n=1 Tax=Streptomyces sp. I05A-00742 TaxID=2732853 RepID=UPI0014879D76|nr:VCBS repeat-containing protein [Streptomyces sp. I05A-00742]
MAHVSGRTLSRVVTAAVAVALAGGTAAGTASAHSAGDQFAGVRAAAAKKPTAAAPVFPVGAVTKANDFYAYAPDGKGGFGHRQGPFAKMDDVDAVQVDRDADGRRDADYFIAKNGDLKWHAETGRDRTIARKFGFHHLVSPGNLGGSKEGDLLATGPKGTLWLFTTKFNGDIASKQQVGNAKEWGGYVQLAGRGDLSGDGKADVVAKDTKGVLWLYKGTGNAKKPFSERTRVGGGWGKYTKLFSNGDLNGDGHSDLLAVDKQGALFLYKGTGKAATPFKSPVKIGNSGWNQYRLVF